MNTSRQALLDHPDAIVVAIEQLEACCVFVADRGGAPVGFAAIIGRENGGAELDALFVEPDQWKGGIGRALVNHCADVAL